jgi:hypothetical protein
VSTFVLRTPVFAHGPPDALNGACLVDKHERVVEVRRSRPSPTAGVRENP